MIERAQFLADELDYSRSRMLVSLGNLTDEQAKWRPSPASNSIISILFHISRIDDFDVNLFLSPMPRQMWVSDGWAEKLGLPTPNDPGALAKTPDGAWPQEMGWDFNALEHNKNVTLISVLDYANSTRELTKKFLATVTEMDLKRPIDDGSPRHKGWDVAKHIAHFALHESHHQGQIDYLKGLRTQLVK